MAYAAESDPLTSAAHIACMMARPWHLVRLNRFWSFNVFSCASLRVVIGRASE
jgi:hypothetical protein